jgi:hypothetical protein
MVNIAGASYLRLYANDRYSARTWTACTPHPSALPGATITVPMVNKAVKSNLFSKIASKIDRFYKTEKVDWLVT